MIRLRCEMDEALKMAFALAFYPVAPGSDQYQLGSPAIKTAVLKLENGKTLTIEAKNQSDKNVYVKRVVVNGETLKRNYLTHAELISGGKIVFYMTNKPDSSLH